METSALMPFYSFSGRILAAAAPSRRTRCLKPFSLPVSSPTQTLAGWRRRSLAVVPRAAAESRGSTGRKAYRQSQGQPSLPNVPLKEIAAVVAPAGAFLAVTFVLWKVVEKVLMPKPSGQRSNENKSPIDGVKWSFSPGTNLTMGNIFKLERDSRQKLNEFVKELRTFRSVDLSGRNFGDDGLFFLAESLGYNQIAEEVDFSGNGITAAGLKAFDGVLQANSVLKTLNLSGNVVGDEGAKVTTFFWRGSGDLLLEVDEMAIKVHCILEPVHELYLIHGRNTSSQLCTLYRGCARNCVRVCSRNCEAARESVRGTARVHTEHESLCAERRGCAVELRDCARNCKAAGESVCRTA
ncbi:hypothetical protein AXF42_Ash019881 [Apostasia shenzhenica]|uniref:Uncharacterized protein n=1 Tax=Apostasia shenzhenica TaxID=1088818 RepID=A0A2H9ZX39_9ASPA|nr:hypothetical protein AXF42_Ash019881 [Apostasia shenzhenica]